MKWIFAFLFVPIFTCNLCRADELLLERGRKLEGKIVDIENNEVTFNTGTNELVIDSNIIKSISTDSSDAQLQAKVAEIQKKIDAVNEKEKARSEEEKEKLTGKKVDLYVFTQCPLCDKMEIFLTQNGVRYTKYNIDQDVRAKRRMHAKGCSGAPCVIINNDRVVSGYDPNGVVEILKE